MPASTWSVGATPASARETHGGDHDSTALCRRRRRPRFSPRRSRHRRGRPGSFGITPYAGYMKFGTLVDGPLGTSVRSAGSRRLRRRGDTRAHARTGPGRQRRLRQLGPRDRRAGQSAVSRRRELRAALRRRAPAAACRSLPAPRISPFVQGGAGAMRQEVRCRPASTHSTNFAYNVGAGVDVRRRSAARTAADGRRTTSESSTPGRRRRSTWTPRRRTTGR